MAESFRNFTTSIQTTNRNQIIIVPEAGSTNGYSQARKSATVAQIHSIYITQNINNSNKKINGKERYNPANFSAFNLGIKNTSTNDITYIIFDGRIVPGSPFFIEKNITLESNQCLFIECPGDSNDINITTNADNYQLNNNTTSVYLDITASTILLDV